MNSLCKWGKSLKDKLAKFTVSYRNVLKMTKHKMKLSHLPLHKYYLFMKYGAKVYILSCKIWDMAFISNSLPHFKQLISHVIHYVALR